MLNRHLCRFFVGAALGLGLSAAPASADPNLLLNPGFEAGLAHFSLGQSGHSALTITSPVHGGYQAVSFGAGPHQPGLVGYAETADGPRIDDVEDEAPLSLLSTYSEHALLSSEQYYPFQVAENGVAAGAFGTYNLNGIILNDQPVQDSGMRERSTRGKRRLAEA